MVWFLTPLWIMGNIIIIKRAYCNLIFAHRRLLYCKSKMTEKFILCDALVLSHINFSDLGLWPSTAITYDDSSKMNIESNKWNWGFTCTIMTFYFNLWLFCTSGSKILSETVTLSLIITFLVLIFTVTWTLRTYT